MANAIIGDERLFYEVFHRALRQYHEYIKILGPATFETLRSDLNAAIAQYAMEQSDGNQVKACKVVGMARGTMRRYGPTKQYVPTLKEPV